MSEQADIEAQFDFIYKARGTQCQYGCHVRQGSVVSVDNDLLELQLI
jgi:hypothetical protein